MRVMWLTQLQLPGASGRVAMSAAGWLEGLRDALQRYEPTIELIVCSWGPVDHRPITSGNATYYALQGPRPTTRHGRLAEAWSLRLVPTTAIKSAVAIGRRCRPDIVHVHGSEHPLGLAAPAIGRPTVVQMQGVATAILPHMLRSVPPYDIVRGAMSRLSLWGSSYLHSVERMRRAATTERLILRAARDVIGQTDWDHDMLRLLNPSARYHRSQCVPQAPFYSSHRIGSADGEKTAFCTTSAMPYKGVETLLLATAMARRCHHGLRLKIAGNIPGSMVWPRLSDMQQRLRLTDAVTWLGPLDAKRLAAELERATLYVLPSHIENTPNALIEAMLVGVPSIAAAVGGVPSLIAHGVDGVLYQDSEPAALAGAMTRLLDDPIRADDLGARAAAQAHCRHDPETVAHGMRRIYDQVVAVQKPAGTATSANMGSCA